LPADTKSTAQARNHEGAKPPLEKFSSSLEKYVEHSLKLLDIAQKIWAPLGKLFARLVSQAGYGPVIVQTHTFCTTLVNKHRKFYNSVGG